MVIRSTTLLLYNPATLMFKWFIHKIFLNKRKEIPFIIFFFFLITFIISRLIVRGIELNVFPKIMNIFFDYVYIKGFHVHHLNFGIIIMAVAGFLSFLLPSTKHLYKLASLYGIGLGLTFDEFYIWFSLNDQYWNRLSYDAIIIISLIFLNIIYFKNFWKKLGKIIIKIASIRK